MGDLVHLARLALSGRPQDVRLLLRRMSKRYRQELPSLSQELLAMLRENPTRSSPLRHNETTALPVDMDSRLGLVRHEVVRDLDVEPILDGGLEEGLGRIVSEHKGADKLLAAGLAPSRTALFTGPPGVGKTLASRWIARELRLPLLTLDLSAVMSSFLGRTGTNLRSVLDYAKGTECVLLLDELDAIAKRRDDASEVGELKRLVTVLLQEIDDWPSDGLLVAATNHSTLLDPAVWRRFDVVLDFPLPTEHGISRAVESFIGPLADKLDKWSNVLPRVLAGCSFSDVERHIMQIRRALVLDSHSVDQIVREIIMARGITTGSRRERTEFVADLVAQGVITQRRAHELFGVSRDTIRKAIRRKEGVG